MAVHVSHAALPYPIKNARFSMLVPLLDADGDPTAQTTPDTEISKDNAAAADAAEEVSATSGMDGVGLITFTGAETDVSALAVNFKAASGPKATLATIYPHNLAIVGSGTLSAGSAGGGTLGTLLAYDVTGCFIRTTGGTGGGGTGGANNQARRIITYNTSTGAFTVSPNWETTPSTDTTYDVLLPEGVTLGMLRTLNPTTAGSTLDVSATGEAGLDFNNIKQATGATTLTNITVPVVTTLTNLPAITAGWLTAAGIAASALNGKGDWNIGKTGYALSSAGVQAIWDALTSALTTVGSIGKLLVDNINATISSRLASASYTTPPTAGQNADAVWEEALADHSGTVGSTAAALNAAGSAGDPWATQLPGAYGPGSAGKIIGDNVNATIGSRASQTSVDDVPTNAELATALAAADDAVLAAIAALNNLAAGAAMTLTAGERNAIATALLDLTNGVEAGITLRQAQRLQTAALAGKRSSCGTANEQYDAAGSPGTPRIVGNLDLAGDGTPTLTP